MSKTRSFAIDVCSVARGLESSIECLSERDSLGGCFVCAVIFEELFSVCLNCRYGTYLGEYGDG